MPVKNYYISADTERFYDNEVDRIIELKAKKYKLNPKLIRAVIKAESNGVIFSVRDDDRNLKKQRWAIKSAKKLGLWDYRYKFFSGGLMHPLYLNAVYMGFKGSFYKFLNPKYNIEIGCKILKHYIDKYKGNIEKGVSAYNMGSARKRNGKYINQDYVDKVMGGME